MADAAVRPATSTDVDEIARIQLDTWRIAYADRLPAGALDGIDHDTAVRHWIEAVENPPTERHRTLIAYEGPARTTVGFAAAGPSSVEDVDNPDGGRVHESDSTITIATLLVEPRWGRRGHGSRLLAATVDLASTNGAKHAVTWLFESDTASLAFYRSAGWEPDGTVRELSAAGQLIREIRLHTSFPEA